MNLAETLAQRGIAPASVSKEQDSLMQASLLDDETGTMQANLGIAQDSFHWAVQEIVPPKNTTPVANPGDELDKQRRKSKAFRKYEAELQKQQDTGPRGTMVQTIGVDNSDIMDFSRSNWFV